MKFSEKWLRSWVNPAVDTKTLCEQLTNLGLEVDGRETTYGYLTGVCVAEIESVETIPNTENQSLQICHLNTGSDVATAVCGAPNARPGIKVAYAKAGATLVDQVVQPSRMHGVNSMGMLCSGAELGYSADVDGILELEDASELGRDIKEVLNLEDHTIDIDLTPNRGDCLSMRGIARETALINELEFVELKTEPVKVEDTLAIPITSENPIGCPRYLGRVITGVDPAASTPGWMVRRLQACGLRSIDPIVDVTNYVMLELGQPLHAFDLRNVQNGITVRDSKQGEKLKLLDGTAIEFKLGTLVITDGETPLAIAGVMGGELSGIHADTTDVFLECAYFSPTTIIGTPREYGLQTDASMRFERGVDSELQTQAIEYATQLLIQVVGGKAGPISRFDSEEHLPVKRTIKLRKARINALIGELIDESKVEQIFERLSFKVFPHEDYWEVEIPSFRFDLEIEEDLVEEICRVYGYNEIGISHPKAAMTFEVNLARVSESSAQRHRVSRLGYYEVINYSFIEKEVNDKFIPEQSAPHVENPIASQFESMRKTLIPGLISSARYNLVRQQSSVRLFEYGKCFALNGEEISQFDRIAGISIGERDPENWTHRQQSTDFYDLKGDVEQLLSMTSAEIIFERSEQAYLHPGQAASVIAGDNVIGHLGKLHPEFSMQMELPEATYVFELDAEPYKQISARSASYVAPFPYVRRDLALLISSNTPVQELCQFIREFMQDLLVELHVFDVYEGENIESNKKSVAIGLVLQDRQKTLTDDLVSQRIEGLIDHLGNQLEVKLR